LIRPIASVSGSIRDGAVAAMIPEPASEGLRTPASPHGMCPTSMSSPTISCDAGSATSDQVRAKNARVSSKLNDSSMRIVAPSSWSESAEMHTLPDTAPSGKVSPVSSSGDGITPQ